MAPPLPLLQWLFSAFGSGPWATLSRARPSTPRIGRLRLDEPDHHTRGSAGPIRPLLGQVRRLPAVGLSSPGDSHTQSGQPRHVAFVHPGDCRDPQDRLLEVVGPVERAGLPAGVHVNQPDVGGTASLRGVDEGRSGAVIPAIDRRWLVPGHCHAGAGTLLLLRSARWGSQLGGDGQGGVHVAVVIARDLVLAGLGGCGPGGGAVAWHG